MQYAYLRVSTKKQKIKRQKDKILSIYPNAKIIAETFTGTTTERPVWIKLLDKINVGDTIIFDSVSRMSRNADDGYKQYMQLFSKGINLIFLNEPHINTATYHKAIQGDIKNVGNEIADIYIKATNEVLKLLAKEQIKLAFEQSEKEVKDLQKRTKDGMTAKGAGKKISDTRTGKTYDTPKAKRIKAIINKHSKYFGEGNLTDKECMQLADCSEATFYKYKKMLLEQSGNLRGDF